MLRWVKIELPTNIKLNNFILQSKLLEWLSFQDATLDELLRHDGLGDFLGYEYCVTCNKEPGLFKCKDCSGGSRLHCQACTVKSHQNTPLHRIEVSMESLPRKSVN